MKLTEEFLNNVLELLPYSNVTLTKKGILVHVTNRVKVGYGSGFSKHLYIQIDEAQEFILGDMGKLFNSWFRLNSQHAEKESLDSAISSCKFLLANMKPDPRLPE